jgi:hypothetical protein
MPWLVCPTCGAVSPRRTWPSVGGGCPFTLRCPCCRASFDIARLTMRLRPPEYEQTARLALRVWLAVAALPADG